MSSTPSPGWFRQHFNEDYRTLYSGRTQEQADREVEFVVGQLGVTPTDRVLDLCCKTTETINNTSGAAPVTGQLLGGGVRVE